MDTTTIEISVENWQRLNGRKRPGESFNDVVSRLLDGPDDSSGETVADLGEVDFPSSRDPEDCEAAVQAARDHLRENGPSTMREIVGTVMPEHPIGYDVPQLESGERYRGSWWRKIVKPGLEALPDIEAPAQGASKWRYVDEK